MAGYRRRVVESIQMGEQLKHGRDETNGRRRYRAFISYSTAADGRLAAALQAGLQRFAKPWYRIRTMRVFRDRTGLGVTPALWGSIEKALGDSDYFVLLASPDSAQSKWVQQEVEWWLRNRSADRLLVVRTDGAIVWDAASRDFDWTRTTALPGLLGKAFVQEPCFLDLTWAQEKADLSLRHPTFADAVARLAATLRNVPLDELIGEDIRQHRRTSRMVGLAMASLAVLTLAALLVALRGERAWRLADRLASEGNTAAGLEARRNLSRRLATDSLNQQGSDRDLSILLAAEAVRVHPTAEAESALRQSLSGDLEPALIVPGHRERQCYAEFSPRGDSVVTWGSETAQILDALTGKVLRELRGHTNDILDARFSPDGRLVCTTGEDSVRLWDAASGKEALRVQHAGVTSARVGQQGTRLLSLALADEAILWNAVDGTELARIPLGSYSGDSLASFAPDGERLAVCARADPRVMNAETGALVWELVGHSEGVRSIDFSPTGDFLVTASDDSTVRIWRTANGQSERILSHGVEAAGVREARFSPDGRWVASRDGQHTLVIWEAATGERVAQVKTTEFKDERPFFRFSPNGECLLTATFRSSTAEIWQTSTGRRLAVLNGTQGEIRTLSFHPKGTRALVGSISAPARVYDCEVCGSVEDLLAVANRRVPRELTREEREKFQIPNVEP